MTPIQPKIRLLGDLDISFDGASVALPKSRKSRALFAYVAVSQRPVNRSRLCSLLFPDTKDPRGNVRWCVSRLKASCASVVGDLVQSDLNNVWLNAPPSSVDVHQLDQVICTGSDDVLALRDLERNTSDTFLAGLELQRLIEFEAWRVTLQAHYRKLREELLGKIIERSMGTAVAVEYSNKLVRLSPDSENSWYLLVRSLTNANQSAEAKKFLEIARIELQQGQIPQEGLLALAHHELIHSHSKPTNLKISFDSHPSDRKPTLSVMNCTSRSISNNGGLLDAVTSAIFSSAICNKTYSLLSNRFPVGEGVSGSIDIRASDKLHADMLLISSIEESCSNFLLELQLVKSATGKCLFNWHHRLENSSSAAIEKKIRAILSRRFEFDLPMVMTSLAREKPVERRTAWDYYYLALLEIYSLEGYSVPEALRLLRQSLLADENLTPALCAMAWVRSTHPHYNTEPHERHKTAKMARRAIERSHDDPFVLAWTAITIANLEKDLVVGRSIVKRAMFLNPYSTMALLAKGFIEHYAGNDYASLKLLDKVDSVEDTGPLTFLSHTCRAQCLYQLGHTNQAIASAKQALSYNPRYIIALRTLAASYARSGKIADAKLCVQRMLKIDSSEHLQFFKEYCPYQNPRSIDRLCEDLRLAGVPDRAAVRS